jgi:hypothetical protein
MMKEKTFDLQDRFIDFAVMNSHLESGYSLLDIGYSNAVDSGRGNADAHATMLHGCRYYQY